MTMELIAIGSLSFILVCIIAIIAWYYWTKNSIRDKVRIAIRAGNGKIKFRNVRIIDDRFKIGKYTYEWSEEVNNNEIEFQILPGLSEYMKYGQYDEGHPGAKQYSTGNSPLEVHGQVLTKIVESKATTEFISGFSSLDNEALAKLLVGGVIFIGVIIAAATYYIKPFTG